ncbi:MAG: carbohydrate kinase family protein [bacterium]|nr:carbohydrate kinase family protein [bacterium]
MKVTCIGAALIDIFFMSEQFKREEKPEGAYLCQKYGHKIEIEEYHLTTGGGASNTAVGFARRGHDVNIVAELGKDDFSQIIRNELIKEKVNTAHMVGEKLEQTGCSVILRGGDGERTVMVSRAASALLDDYDIPETFLRTQDWIHLSSTGGNARALAKIWQIFTIKPSIGLSWNPGTKELALLAQGELALPKIKKGVFFVNKQEWESVAARQAEILATFPIVVMTNGGEGGQILVKGQPKLDFLPARHGESAFEATGAGDAFACAFVSTLLYDRPLEEALEAAKNNSDSVIRHLGSKKGLLSF